MALVLGYSLHCVHPSFYDCLQCGGVHVMIVLRLPSDKFSCYCRSSISGMLSVDKIPSVLLVTVDCFSAHLAYCLSQIVSDLFYCLM